MADEHLRPAPQHPESDLARRLNILAARNPAPSELRAELGDISARVEDLSRETFRRHMAGIGLIDALDQFLDALLADDLTPERRASALSRMKAALQNLFPKRKAV